MAPDLVQVFEKYRQNGVVFVGVSRDDETVVRHYVDRYHIPWRVAVVGEEVIWKLGASLGRGGATLPTLLVIAPGGRIAWTDRAARWNHSHDADLMQHLSKAIDTVLSQRAN